MNSKNNTYASSICILMTFIFFCTYYPGLVVLTVFTLGIIEMYSRLTAKLSDEIENAKEGNP